MKLEDKGGLFACWEPPRAPGLGSQLPAQPCARPLCARCFLTLRPGGGQQPAPPPPKFAVRSVDTLTRALGVDSQVENSRKEYRKGWEREPDFRGNLAF